MHEGRPEGGRCEKVGLLLMVVEGGINPRVSSTTTVQGRGGGTRASSHGGPVCTVLVSFINILRVARGEGEGKLTASDIVMLAEEDERVLLWLGLGVGGGDEEGRDAMSLEARHLA